ncbi:MAG: sulfatase family protein, partial [Planctomycetota bacterium]
VAATGAGSFPARLAAWGASRPRSGAAEADALRDALAQSSLVICVIDAARVDHFGCYGYARETTPNVDLLARESLVFRRHFCQDTNTASSVASMFTGQHPDTHLAYGYRPVSSSAFTIARGLAAAGFQTALFSSNAWASPLGGKGLDFQKAYSTKDAVAAARPGEEWHSPEPLLRLFEGWLQDHRQSRFFCYLHFVPPHKPYPRADAWLAPFRGKMPPGYRPEKYHPGESEFPIPGIVEPSPALPEWINLYDSNLCYADWAAGQVVRILRESGVYDRTALIVTTDHGEAFGEHGYTFHNSCPWDEVAHIPLVMRLPHAARTGRVNGLTQCVDLLPTLCDLFRVTYPSEKVQGASLIPLITGAKDEVHDYVFTHSNTERDKYMVRSASHALLLYGEKNRRALYSLKDDPEQQKNVIASRPREAEKLTQAFRLYAKQQRWNIMYIIDPSAPYAPRPRNLPGRPVSPETLRQLKTLGYL